MDSDIDFGFSHRHKRTHAQMDHDGSSSPTWSTFNRLAGSREPSASASHPHVSGMRLPRIGAMPTAPAMPSSQPRRYSGDGFDFRRPVLSSRNESQDNVIDLTVDEAGPSAPSSTHRADSRAQRPPRFAREIIDIDDESSQRPPAAPESPEIQFISARRIDPPHRQDRQDHQDPRPIHAHADEDDVEFVRSNVLPEAQMRRERHLNMMHVFDLFEEETPIRGPFVHLRAQIERRLRPVPPPRGRSRGQRISLNFIAPDLNFGLTGFDMGMGADPPPPPPTYDAPSKAPEGFTRSPAEDDVLICPNCEGELCIGDAEQKKQVWIVKGCGHVYCGDCTANRFTKRSAKGKEKQAPARTKPFKECVVDGCHRKVANRASMIQVFL